MTWSQRRVWWVAAVTSFFVAAALSTGWVLLRFGARAILGPRVRRLTSRKFDSTPARLARGAYLVNGVAHCFGCHSPLEGSDQRTGAAAPGKEGTGDSFQLAADTLFVLPNLTPDPDTGIGKYTDDQLARGIREGIGHDGRALMPMMPYRHFRHMSDEDLASVIAYLRSRPAVRHVLPSSKVPLLRRWRYARYPEPVLSVVAPPDFSDPIRRGAYYVELGKCADCHTPLDDHGDPLPGLTMAGGTFLEEVNKATPNLTRDASGIAYYDENTFIRAMRTGKVGARQLDSIMPWWFIGHMNDDDLKAIFAYLRSLPPVHHRVDNDLPPTFCRVCRQKHGAGNQN